MLKQGALIAMSGGVDSSVAALLTCKMSENTTLIRGGTMRLQEIPVSNDGLDGTGVCDVKDCKNRRDEQDAAAVCAKLAITHETLDFTAEFKACVIDKFIRTYESGATPNPCIDCNRNLKFGLLFKAARERGLSEIVTGHYARVEFNTRRGRWLLKRACDLTRDQSYVLYCLTQEQLAHVHFPLGDFKNKNEVRALAEANGFVNAHRRDSQDICFIPDGNYAGFLECHSGRICKPGNFVEDKTGKILGQHRGIVRYTIGQRKGLGIAAKSPLYVKAIEPTTNTVILTSDESAIYTKTVFVDDLNFISVPEPEIGNAMRVTARLRYRQNDQPATATLVTRNSVKLLRLDFDEPQRAPACGQAAVLYDYDERDIVVGGGTIIGTE